MIQKYITKSVFRPLLYNELALSIKSESFDKGKSPDEEGYPEKKGCLIIVKNEAEANKLRYLLESLQPSHKIAVFTDNDSLIGDSYNFFSAEQLASSFKILQNLLDCKSLDKKIVILPYRSAITPIKNIAKLSKKYQVLTLSKNRDYKFDQIIERLVELGYKRTDLAVSTAQFAVRGGIIDIVEASSNKAFRLDFFGDKLDEISSYNTLTQRSMKFDEIDGPQGKIKDLKIQQIKDLKIWPIVNFFETQKTGKKSLIEYFIPTYKLVIPDYELLQTFEKDFQDFAQLGLAENGQKFSDYYFSMAELFAKISKTPVKQLNNNANSSIILVSPFEANFANFQMSNALFENKVFEDKVIEKIYKPNISQKTLNFLENLPYTYEASQFKAIRQKKNIINPMQLTKGDILVHERYGIGKYLGLTKRYLEVNDFENNNFEKPYQEYIEIAYAPNARLKTSQIKYGITSKTSDYDRLLVSTSDLSQVTKYIGHDNPRLSELGSAHWKKARRAARRLAREITEQLVSVYSKRLAIQGFSYLADTQEQKNFEDEFKFVETPDQIKTAEVVKADMESEYPMDRLICGDVGYGKTEIALRAAFKAVDNAKQVAILAPTTLLVNQHYETCLKRFKNTAFRIEYLSRFQSAKKTKKIIEDTKLGKVDILIGTHKLLSDKISYFSLGLIIIDEEQRFGVSQKEKLRQINPSVDVLQMSATPIPRTLEMALSGVKQLSTLSTPPLNRLPIITRLAPYSLDLAVLAIRQELLRSGQVFYIHNNIFTIDKVVLQLQEKLSAKAVVAAAHSKLDKNKLDKITNDFYQGKIDVLVCTTIIETGIDIPNANTIIIDQADKLGLVQLHQIRGRVGRSAAQSFCYLFYDKAQLLSSQSYKRLETIVENQQLGSGLTIAMRDLELRGAGNFLGSEQSGKIEGVGYDLYTKMVTEALEIYKNGNLPSGENVIMETDFNIHIPHTYIYEQSLRLEIYRKIDLAKTEADLKLVKEELQDRFGKLPEQVENIFIFQKIKNLSSAKGVRSIIVKQGIAKIDQVEFSFKISFDKKTPVHLFDKKRLIQLYNFVNGVYN